MSGEITLRGRVLPIGGVRDKILAAYRLKLDSVIIPKKNEKDLVEIPRQARNALQFHLVEHMDQVLDIGLRAPSKKATRSTKAKKSSSSRKKKT
jgi:ATP-dependent Lon protease